MLRLTRLTNMDPSLLMMMKMMMVMMSLVVMSAADPQCDPYTQYAISGQCCKMCGPGTRMTSLGSCQEPQCQPCGEKEYQEKYTKELKCERQPYCDRNGNFDIPVRDPTKRSVCKCAEGFHCSDQKECMTCVPHTTCKPGEGVQFSGNHSHDTVCEECLEGSYSDEESSVGVCKKLTECGFGQHVERKGTSTSDTVCGGDSRTHVVIAVVIPLVLTIVLAAVLFVLCRGQRCQEKVKGCFESSWEPQREQLNEEKIFIPEHPDPLDEESISPEMQSTQEEGFTRTPEEDDEQSVPMSPTALTDRGNLVTQENGKAEQLSRQESQTQCTDSFDTSL